MTEDPIEAALRRCEPAGPTVGTHELVAGARRRAAQLRTRRRAGVGVLALALVGVPAGIGVGGGMPEFGAPGSSVAVSGPASQPVQRAAEPSVSSEQMLPDDTVAAVVPAAVREDDAAAEPGADVAAGLCVDVAFGEPTLGGRSTLWANLPTREGVRQTVHRFSGDGAATFVQVARDQAASCAVSAPETGPWTLVGDGSTGPDDLVTAWALAGEPDASGESLYRVRAIVERDGVVVDVFADLRRENPDDLSATAADRAAGGLDAVLGGGRPRSC